MKVYIDASCDIQYSSYYIYGLYELYGKTNVKFSSKYFKGFKHDNHFFAFVVQDSSGIKKVVVDFTDSSIIDQNALNWCTIYGKINLEESQRGIEKVIPIGPSFGIRIFNLVETLWYAFTNLFKSYHRTPKLRKFLSDYKAQYKRPQFSDYHYKQPKTNYVFFMASLWKQEDQTNRFRAHFIHSCKSITQLTFEGGFAPRTRNDMEGYEAITSAQRIDMGDYLEHTKDSILVFNTPAVKNCHGWKLAEYLCLGKAILSTPLTRVLPEPLTDQKNILFTDGSREAISKTLQLLIENDSLRQSLEHHAKVYFDTHLSPKQVISRLVSSLT